MLHGSHASEVLGIRSGVGEVKVGVQTSYKEHCQNFNFPSDMRPTASLLRKLEKVEYISKRHTCMKPHATTTSFARRRLPIKLQCVGREADRNGY